MVEKVLYLSQIFEMESLTVLQIFKDSESENQIYSNWALSLCVCVSVISITEKQITVESSNFSILHLYHIQMLLEPFHKDRTKTLCTGAHKRILIH